MKIEQEKLNESMEIIQLKMEKYFLKHNWTAEFILDPYSFAPYIQSTVIRKFATSFLGERKYSHPKNTWEYFKQNHFPKWLKKYFPVKIKTIVFSFRAVFPNFKPPDCDGLKIWEMDVGKQQYYE